MTYVLTGSCMSPSAIASVGSAVHSRVGRTGSECGSGGAVRTTQIPGRAPLQPNSDATLRRNRPRMPLVQANGKTARRSGVTHVEREPTLHV